MSVDDKTVDVGETVDVSVDDGVDDDERNGGDVILSKLISSQSLQGES